MLLAMALMVRSRGLSHSSFSSSGMSGSRPLPQQNDLPTQHTHSQTQSQGVTCQPFALSFLGRTPSDPRLGKNEPAAGALRNTPAGASTQVAPEYQLPKKPEPEHEGHTHALIPGCGSVGRGSAAGCQRSGGRARSPPGGRSAATPAGSAVSKQGALKLQPASLRGGPARTRGGFPA